MNFGKKKRIKHRKNSEVLSLNKYVKLLTLFRCQTSLFNCLKTSKNYLTWIRCMFLFCFIFSINQFVFPQQNLKIGFEIGSTYSKFETNANEGFQFYEHSPDYDHKGWTAGLSFSYPVHKYLSPVVTIGYAKRGTTITRDFGIVGFTSFTVNYLDTSVGIGVSPFKWFTINTGIHANYFLNESDLNVENRFSRSRDFYNDFDIGYRLGATITIKGIYLSGRHFQSLRPSRSIGGSVLSNEDTRYHNKSFEIVVGYQMDFKKLIKFLSNK